MLGPFKWCMRRRSTSKCCFSRQHWKHVAVIFLFVLLVYMVKYGWFSMSFVFLFFFCLFYICQNIKVSFHLLFVFNLIFIFLTVICFVFFLISSLIIWFHLIFLISNLILIFLLLFGFFLFLIEFYFLFYFSIFYFKLFLY